jgi:hypothetical protein
MKRRNADYHDCHDDDDQYNCLRQWREGTRIIMIIMMMMINTIACGNGEKELNNYNVRFYHDKS